jgi:hypothetical protein
MKPNFFAKITLFIPVALAAFFLSSCAASQHAGVANIQRPALTETNEDTWFTYWQDQLDAFEGRVLAPPMEYPAVAKSAYARANQEWNMKVADASTKTYLAWSGGAVLLSVLLLLVI